MNIGMVYGAIAFAALVLYGITICLVMKWTKFRPIWITVWFALIAALVMSHIGSGVSGGLSAFTWIVLVIWFMIHLAACFEKSLLIPENG